MQLATPTDRRKRPHKLPDRTFREPESGTSPDREARLYTGPKEPVNSQACAFHSARHGERKPALVIGERALYAARWGGQHCRFVSGALNLAFQPNGNRGTSRGTAGEVEKPIKCLLLLCFGRMAQPAEKSHIPKYTLAWPWNPHLHIIRQSALWKVPVRCGGPSGPAGLKTGTMSGRPRPNPSAARLALAQPNHASGRVDFPRGTNGATRYFTTVTRAKRRLPTWQT